MPIHDRAVTHEAALASTASTSAPLMPVTPPGVAPLATGVQPGRENLRVVRRSPAITPAMGITGAVPRRVCAA
jgi:hypothetical protein